LTCFLLQLLPKCSKPQAVKTLDTLSTLLSNILSPPNPLTAAKFRQIRLSNALIRSAIVEPANGAGQVYLVAAGFRAQNVEFVPYLVFSPSPTPAQLHKLRVAHHVIGLKLGGAKEAEEREKRHREAEKEAEAGAFVVSSFPLPALAALCAQRTACSVVQTDVHSLTSFVCVQRERNGLFRATRRTVV
jgi:hypothetical protein